MLHVHKHMRTHAEIYSLSCEMEHLSVGGSCCLASFHTAAAAELKQPFIKMSLDLSSAANQPTEGQQEETLAGDKVVDTEQKEWEVSCYPTVFL